MACISVSNVGKGYKRYRSRWGRITEWLTGGRKLRHEAHWVLRNVSFEVAQGESIGIIGQNGAGKSTLLKVLTGTTQPSEGSVRLVGRVAALLELGMGFHPDFTGRQNAFMAGQILGLSNADIQRLMPDIEAFAEIGDYLDQPVRTYSSGMQVRLAFSVATAVRPDILIVDEALSVGDAYFQHKCFQRIRSFREAGTTLLFVSHDPGAVKNLCDRALLLDGGAVIRDGSPEEVLDYYNAVIAMREADYQIRQSRQSSGKSQLRSGNGGAEILQVQVYRSGEEAYAVQVGDPVEVRVRFVTHQAMVAPTVGILFKDRLGNEIFGTNTYHLDGEHASERFEVGRPYEVSFRFPFNFGLGHYSLTAALHSGSTHVMENYDWWDHAQTIQVVPGDHPEFIGVIYVPVSVDMRACDPHQEATA